MSVRADWNLAETVSDEPADPFEAMAYTAGVEIDLRAPEGELAAKLNELVELEVALASGPGIRCKLKVDGQDCRSCPSATLDPRFKRSQLCRIGKDQEAVWAAAEAAQERRMAPVKAMAAVADEMSEMGHLDGELIELLTAAGL